ncbi:hypothetical protein MMC21_007658 [Puttea exsequens]|nr:hypothetical protein [Puttea exsequens]
MGQRHQLFVIAKIDGRYRTLCAIHHQWLYGHTALRRCLDTLNIFGDGINRMPIQQELKAASKKEDDFWTATREEYHTKNSHVPFPFIATCGDNNGITIFDIADLTKVRYCFVDFMGMESERQVQLMTPLSARTYLEAYYDLDEAEDRADLKLLLKSFEGKDLPDGDWQEIEDVAEEAKAPSHAFEPDDHEMAPDQNMTSLRDWSMDMLLESLLNQSEDNPELIAEAELITDFTPKPRTKLFAKAESLEPSSFMLHLLYRVFEDKV